MKQGTYIVLLVVAFMGALLFRTCSPNATPHESTIQRDTIVIRDTIHPPLPKPEVNTVVRYDTVRPQAKPIEGVTPALAIVTLPEDTIPRITPENGIIIPITQKTYKTEDYKAVIEGYKPNLLSIELYQKNTFITNTVTNTKYKSPRWVISVGPGVGYGPKGIEPYIGINAGFVLWGK